MAEKKRLALALALLFAVNSIIISQAQSAQAATYRVGSTGSEVRTIQTKLKNWGYYDGSVDGIYGSGTAAGVREFQEENDLDNDGVIVWDGGNTGADGKTATANFLSGMMKSIPPMNEMFDMAGMKLPDYLGKEKVPETVETTTADGSNAAG